MAKDDKFGGDELYSGESKRPQPYPIHEVMAALQIAAPSEVVLPAGVVYGLSDLSDGDLVIFREGWFTLPVERRRYTVTTLAEIGESAFDLDFTRLSYILLKDTDPEVRSKAVDLSWHEISVPTFEAILALQNDPIAGVRAAAMSGLGRFIMAGELEEFDAEYTRRAQEAVIRFYEDESEDIEVRRRALEALSHSSHPRLNAMIAEAFDHEDSMMRASAVFAMGSSSDPRWNATVLESLQDDIPEIVFEAIRSAGNLEIEEAIPELADFIQSDDPDLKSQAIWSLGQIASQEARRVLSEVAAQAEDDDDDELLEIVQDALDMQSLLLMDDLAFGMFDFDEDDDDFNEFEDYEDDDVPYDEEKPYLN